MKYAWSIFFPIKKASFKWHVLQEIVLTYKYVNGRINVA